MNIFTIFHMKIKPSHKTDKVVIKKRNFSNFDINLYKDELKKCLMSENLEYLDVNNCVELYEASLPSALDIPCPIITQTVRERPHQQWFDSNLREMKRKKELLNVNGRRTLQQCCQVN